MSITLITASPGAGKTIYAVWHIIKPAIQAGKVVYSCAIPDLKIPTIRTSYNQIRSWHEYDLEQIDDGHEQIDDGHEQIDDGHEQIDDGHLGIEEGKRKLKYFTEGSIIVVDECQYLWPAGGSKITEDINYLTMHRKHGLQFVLITQSPQLIHKNVLAVVDRHIHIVSNWHGRNMYEWPEYCSTVRAVSSKMRAITTKYQLPKEAYGMYRSASVHIKPVRKKPIGLYFIPILFIVLPYLFYLSYSKVQERLVTELVTASTEQPAQEVLTTQTANTQQQYPVSSYVVEPVKTAPVTYTLVSDSTDWSKVSSCLSTETRCICYGYSAERLVIPPETCRLAVKHGWPARTIQLPATES